MSTTVELEKAFIDIKHLRGQIRVLETQIEQLKTKCGYCNDDTASYEAGYHAGFEEGFRSCLEASIDDKIKALKALSDKKNVEYDNYTHYD